MQNPRGFSRVFCCPNFFNASYIGPSLVQNLHSDLYGQKIMTALSADKIFQSITPTQQAEPDSGILVAFNHGRTIPGLIPLWVGEGNLPTPQFICDAAHKSMLRGDTFYTYQRGIPKLRNALAKYHADLYDKEFDSENFYVTGGGMLAMQTIFQLLTKEGDEIILPTPAWPNYPGPLRMKGVKPVQVPMTFADNQWELDLQRMFDATTDKAVAICINSPSNPIGSVVPMDHLIAIRDFARERGIWVIADEVYNRFYYPNDNESLTDRPVAPSFSDDL